VRYGFLIDHDRCIGCHACTVACKAENSVPVGDFRTWVKYAEVGTFPDVRRHFAVLRCNHCDNAPCVTICPVNALEKRDDGIVDIDRDACIGCRACMQACPYDAIYLNDDSGAVEKCHFCAHRVENGLEPACVIVCPETAIITGDLDDPDSPLSRLIADNDTLVRRPEQGTGPNVHYKGAHASLLEPGSSERPEMYLWSDRPPDKPEPWPVSLPVLPSARTVLDTGHRIEWGWPVALYLLTKSIAAGLAILAPLAARMGLGGWAQRYLPETVAIVMTIVTVGLLIEDLARPSLFYRLLTRPNWRSWLVKGGIVLGVFGAGLAAALGLRIAGLDGPADAMRWVNAALGVAAAGYTAFLFKQCEGRDLWQEPGLFEHLLVQAVLCGALVMLPMSDSPATLRWVVILASVLHFIFALHAQLGHHRTTNARQGAAFLDVVRAGRVGAFRWGLILGVGVVLVVMFPWPWAATGAGLVGLLLYEWAFVRAGQLPPLS